MRQPSQEGQREEFITYGRQDLCLRYLIDARAKGVICPVWCWVET